jgi:hypothetical protein
MPTLDQGWAALLGAVAGGFFAFLATYVTLVKNDRAQRRRETALDSATALVIEDDFLHYQATLAHALDDGCWWDPVQLLAAQATVKDRKRVWAVLPNDETELVAGAQGWMAILIQRRSARGTGTPLTPKEEERIQRVFCDLERSRQALHSLTGRQFKPFDESDVLDELNHRTTMQALIGRPSC